LLVHVTIDALHDSIPEPKKYLSQHGVCNRIDAGDFGESGNGGHLSSEEFKTKRNDRIRHPLCDLYGDANINCWFARSNGFFAGIPSYNQHQKKEFRIDGLGVNNDYPKWRKSKV